MSNASNGLFWDIRGGGMMSASLVLPLFPVLEITLGAQGRDRIFQEAGLLRTLNRDDAIPEARVAELFRLVREAAPDLAPDILDRAGRITAEAVVMDRITARTRLLLQNMPWSIAAWMVGRLARQNAWAFSGSGTFAIQTTSRFALFNNPLLRDTRTDGPVCHFHAAMFEHMFQRLVHRDFTCREAGCCGTGDQNCTFLLTV